MKEVTCHTLISNLELSGNEKAVQVFIGKKQARVKPREISWSMDSRGSKKGEKQAMSVNINLLTSQ